MSIALHIDGRMMTSLHQHRGELVGRRSPASYIAMPPDDAEKRLLERARIPYATCDGGTVVFGRYAEELAPLLHVPRLPVLPEGRLPEDDPVGRQLAAGIFESLIPEPLLRGEICAISMPLALTEPVEATREWKFFSQLTRLRGYQPIAVDVRVAAALSGLGHAGFSGLSLHIDATASGLSLIHRGETVVAAVTPCGGDWIDEHLARKTERLVWDMDGACYVDLDAIVRWKRENSPNLHSPQNDQVQLLAYIYEQLLVELLSEFRSACENQDVVSTLLNPTVMLCGGAATSIAGFPQLLADLLQKSPLPMQVSELRSADDPEFAIVRGGLIRAEIESEAISGPKRRAA
jgi:hypothetical protein